MFITPGDEIEMFSNILLIGQNISPRIIVFLYVPKTFSFDDNS